jgi:TfoX/Sxy family transcriptional regulator of competence genes
MAYNEEIDARIRKIVSGWKDTTRKKMFGGVCHLLNGNMFCCVYKGFLILRLGEKGADEALGSEFARPFDITGRPMRGWVMIESEGFKDDEALEEWLNEAKEFADTLPSK